MKKEYVAKTEAIAQPLVDELGFELVDVEFVKEGRDYFLRAYIDKPGGITIDDCEALSRRLSDALDADDFIDEAYILEVSSPGLDRPLTKEKDFLRHMGEEVDVKVFRPIDGQKVFRGIVTSCDDTSFVIETEDGQTMQFSYKDVAKTQLVIEF